MKRNGVVSSLLTIALWASVSVACAQQEQPAKPDAPAAASQPTAAAPALPMCPVMEQPIDFSIRTLTDNGPVYFCCDACIKMYEANPAKYADKVTAQREALKKPPRVQVTCPISGKPVDGKTSVTVDGQTVSFCCPDCPAKYRQEPAKYKGKLEAAYTYQTRCPVSGEPINPTAFCDLPTGQRVYLCCKDCAEKLLADPGKYAPQLAKQGIKIKLKSAKPAEDKPATPEHDSHEHH